MVCGDAMIHSRDILNSLPLLAAVLGRNYGVEVRIGGHKAMTNGKVIHIPSLPLDREAALLGYARGYIDHEAAHIRHSDFAALKTANLDAVTFTLTNAIEDWRIEQRQAELFPGCRQHFDWLTRKLCLEDRQETEEAGTPPAFSIVEYVILVTSAWAVPEVWNTLHPVQNRVDARFPGLRTRMDAVLDRAHAHCPDTAAAIAYARELAEIIRSWQPPAPKQEEATRKTEKQDARADNAPSGETSSQTCPKAPAPCDTDSALQSESQPEQPAPCGVDSDPQPEEIRTASCAPTQEANTTDMEPSIATLFSMDAEAMPQSKGERAAQTLTARHSPYHTALTVAVERPAKPHTVSSAEKEEALRISIALRHRLQGLLQAHTRQDVGTGRRGGLDTARLHRLSIGNPRVFRKEEERAGLNTAVHILLDASSSMTGESIRLARQACFAVAKALHGIRGINPAVTAFPSSGPDDSVCPLMRHGAPLPRYLNMDAHGGTPLAPALWWVMQTMLPLRENRKLILTVTDGEPDSIKASIAALDTARKAGFEVYGIGIKNGCISRLLPQSSRIVWKLPELAPAMFDLLQNTLPRA